MTPEKAAQVLNIELPTTRNALKSAFRRRSREEHPDVSKHPQAAERFNALKMAVELLQDSQYLIVGAKESHATMTVCGTPLSELGKGLGPTTNGKPCGACNGLGFKTWYSKSFTTCPDCRTDLLRGVSYRCHKCGGDGNFKKGGRVVGGCYRCAATGWFTPKRPSYRNNCRTCKGEGMLVENGGNPRHDKCYHCEGTGELLVFNPVLPKGLLV